MTRALLRLEANQRRVSLVMMVSWLPLVSIAVFVAASFLSGSWIGYAFAVFFTVRLVGQLWYAGRWFRTSCTKVATILDADP